MREGWKVAKGGGADGMAVVIVSGGGGAAPGGRQYLLWVGFRTVLGVLAGWFGAFWVESCRLRKSVRAKIAAE